MVRVVGKEGALRAGVSGNCSSGMDGSEKITRRYPGRGSMYYSGGVRYQVGRLSKRKRGQKKRGGGGGFKRFRSHDIIEYTPAMRSRLWSTLIFATLCVILRSRVLFRYASCLKHFMINMVPFSTPNLPTITTVWLTSFFSWRTYVGHHGVIDRVVFRGSPQNQIFGEEIY